MYKRQAVKGENLHILEVKKVVPKALAEKTEDTLLDIMNSSAYALILLNNVWS